jgi:lipopolysaccharide export system ATP-binding protein
VVLLEVHNLKKRYGGFGSRGRLVVNDVSFTVDRGEVVGLLGPNGAGKTTTFRMVMGMVPPDSGRVVLRGEDVTRLPMYQRARRGMGYLSQEPSVFRPLTVEENIMAVLEVIKMKRAERLDRRQQLLERLELTHLAKNRADTLSGGERRRLEITRALVSRPSLLLLDEPFSGVDPIAVFEIRTIILRLKKQGMGILLTDHSVREVLSITDRSYIINAGKVLIGGTPEEVIADPRARKVYLGETFAEEVPMAGARPAAPAHGVGTPPPGRPQPAGLDIHDHIRDVSFHVSGEELLREFRQEGERQKDAGKGDAGEEGRPGVKDNGPGG